MSDTAVVVAANASWNLLNFRRPIIQGLQEQGYKVVAVAPRDSATDALRNLGVTVHDIAIDSRGVSPVRDLQLLRSYHRLLKDLRPFAFLGFTAKPNIYGSLAASQLGIPAINTITGLGSAFLGGRGLEAIITTLYRVALRRSDHVFFHNPDDRDLFVRRTIVSLANSSVVPGSGVDLDRFSPVRGGPENRPFTFLYLGRPLRDKGAGEFIRAAALVKRNQDARFVMAGALNADLNEISVGEALLAESGVELVEPVEDVRPLIAASDCLVLPSYREGLPRALLEAAAMAKPAIAANVAGCRHVVDHGITGLLCEPRSAESLAQCMVAIARLPRNELNAMGKNARRKSEKEFSERLVVDAYLERLDAVAGKGKAG